MNIVDKEIVYVDKEIDYIDRPSFITPMHMLDAVIVEIVFAAFLLCILIKCI